MHPKGANSMVMSGLSFRKILVGTGWAISLLLRTIGLTLKTVLSPCRASISSIEGFFVSAPECRDIETALYDRTSVRAYVRTYVRTYVFSELCSIFQYVITRGLRALQLSGSREHKSDYGCL